MGTKTKPGKFDCYAAAADDEPMFVLLARDRHAAQVVRHWVTLRLMEQLDGGPAPNREKLQEAIDCADAMEEWAARLTAPDEEVQPEQT